MLTHAEVEQKLDELMVSNLSIKEKTAALYDYLRTLSAEDQMYATSYGIGWAYEDMQSKTERCLRG